MAEWTVMELYKEAEVWMPCVVSGHPEPRFSHDLQLQMAPLKRLMLRLAGHKLLLQGLGPQVLFLGHYVRFLVLGVLGVRGETTDCRVTKNDVEAGPVLGP